MTPAQNILRYFDYDHLPEGPVRDTAQYFKIVAMTLADEHPAGPEHTTGLRKLLEAKDCFVRAALDLPMNYEIQSPT